MTRHTNLSVRTGLALAALCAVAGCGGGTDGTGGSPPVPAAPVTSNGVMTKGSVIVNGLRFDDTTAIVSDDRGRTAAQLASGMVVKVRGRSDDNLNGTAERVDVENEVRAAISSLNATASPQSFVAGGLTVYVDGATVYANVSGFAALTLGMRVEVHGLRDASGNLRAARVEAVAAGVGADELRGPVAVLNTTADTFQLNTGITVNYAGATFLPAGASEASLANGVLVEVRGSLSGTVFTATQIDIEELEDSSFRGSAGEKAEAEGFVTGFTAHPGTFQVNGRSITTTASTRFVGGSAADLINGAKVEAEGVVNAQGGLTASKIEFRSTRVLLEGLVTGVNLSARTVTVLGQVVQVNDLTRLETRGSSSSSLSALTPNVDCAEVRAVVNGGVLVAEEVKEPSSCSGELVQARVTAKNDSAFTLTFFGSLQASLANASTFRDASGNSVTRAQFFALISAASGNASGTLVKVKGNSLQSVQEAEIED